MAVAERLLICHCKSEQLVIFGRPANALDDQVPDAAGTDTDPGVDAEDDEDEALVLLDELALPDELELGVLADVDDGAVGRRL